jgi:hypothetical protein
MESATDLLNVFLARVVDGIAADAAAKGQKIPIASLRSDVSLDGVTGATASLYAADYFKYLIYGRGPGKFPPVDNMRAWVEANPDALTRAKAVYKYITANQLAFLVGRKISQQGTDIYTGKKKGIDLLGIMENNMPDLFKSIAQNEAIKIGTALKSAIK